MKTKRIFYVIILLLFIVNSSLAQKEELNINYGIFKTTYTSNSKIITQKEFKSIIKKNEIAFSSYSNGKKKMVIGNIIVIPSVILLFVTIDNSNNGNTPYTWQWIGGIGGSLLGTILYYSGKKNVLNSINIYNLKKQTSLHIINNGCNLGLALKF